MPSLDDLKKNAINPTAVDSKIPTVSVGQPMKDEGFVPTVEMGTPDPRPISMMSGRPIAKPSEGNGERVKADLSSLPKPKPTGKTALDPRSEIINDVFGEGGQFDKYKQRKEKEMREFMEQQSIEQEAEMSEEVQVSGQIAAQEEMSMEDEVEADYVQEEKPVVQIDLMEGMDDIVAGIDSSQEESRNAIPVMYQRKEEDVQEEKEVVTPLVPVPEIEVDPVDVNIDTPNVGGGSTSEEEDTDIHLDDDFELDIVSVDGSVTEKETGEEVETTEDNISEEDRLNYLKSLISAKIRPVAKKLDLSTFRVTKKVVTTTNVFSSTEAIAATWPLPYSGTVIAMKSWTGAELETLRGYMEDETPNNRGALNMIYNHITSPKPAFEKWMKSVYFFDYPHLMMAVYAASFNGVNYVPVDCTNEKCPNKMKTYLTDNIPIMNMVHFETEEAKERFMKLYKSDTYQTDITSAEIVPINEELAIGFKIPTLYTVMIEPLYFNEQFANNHAQTINLLPYIDNMYKINMETRELDPIGYKIYTNNMRKTVLGRCVRYDRILNQLSPDEYNIVGGFTNNINDTMNDKVGWDYRYPETTCPKCGHVNPESGPMNPANMVFTRNRLGLLASI